VLDELGVSAAAIEDTVCWWAGSIDMIPTAGGAHGCADEPRGVSSILLDAGWHAAAAHPFAQGGVGEAEEGRGAGDVASGAQGDEA